MSRKKRADIDSALRTDWGGGVILLAVEEADNSNLLEAFFLRKKPFETL